MELLTCGHSGNRHVSAVSLALDGSEGPRYIVANEYDGKPLNSPNDVIVVRCSTNGLAGGLTVVCSAASTDSSSAFDFVMNPAIHPSSVARRAAQTAQSGSQTQTTGCGLVGTWSRIEKSRCKRQTTSFASHSVLMTANRAARLKL